jgi:Rieske Fe-S protein
LAGISALLVGLVGGAVIPRAAETSRRWRKVISIFDLPPDGPAAAVVAERRADGWYQTRKQSVIFIDREGEGYRALSATCSHLGCRVRWVDEASEFHCPCHGGIYDREGRVLAGPPPEPLRRLAVRVNEQTSEIEVEL